MKVESATVIVLSICIFLSFYFSLLTFQTTDEASKKQLVSVAASSVVASVILSACLVTYATFKKAFSRMDSQLENDN